MAHSKQFLTGVIEGFYGRSWSLDARLAYADYLSAAGLNTFLYCPKEDPFLRKRWGEEWPASEWRGLANLAEAYRQRGINWGVGLSPVELYREYGNVQRDLLKRKIEHLCELSGSVLAILFDDMPGDMDALAARQAEIVADVCSWAPGVRVLACPTYYSFDPVLERFFGAMPRDYWPSLGRNLPAEVDIFWTGNEVCSSAIQAADIKSIVESLGRQVMLWDNYPVNDGAVRSNFLYTHKLADRSPDLRPYLTGHMCNPMNQALLSLPALSGLAELYGTGVLDEGYLAQTLGPRTWACLERDGRLFEQQGLSGLGVEKCELLAQEYADLPGQAAREVTQWLRGEYRFDPHCLTD